MVIRDGIEVYIARKSDGQRYAEYTPPAGSPAYTGNPNEVYIQAREGEHFSVRRRVLPYFDFMDVTQLKTNVAIGEHQHEGLDTSEDCVNREIESSGRITVSVQRGSAKYLAEPKLRNARRYTSETKSSASKDVTKAGLVSHTTDLVPLQQIAPPPIAKVFEVASGLTGKPCLRLLKIVDLDEVVATISQDACTSMMSDLPIGPSTKGPTTPVPTTKTEKAMPKKEEVPDPKTLRIKREHAVTFDEDDITIVSSRRAPNMQTPGHSVRNIASSRQSKLADVDRERKKAHSQLRRKEMELEREELALRKRELAI
nr:hypothetical protein B0A51_02039 [Rachicladosporium sp. CCFEE 5018]